MNTIAQDVEGLLAQAWDHSHADPARAKLVAQMALDAAERGSEQAAWAFWLLALAEVQAMNAPLARARLHPARGLFVEHGSKRGQALCAELEAALALQVSDPMRASLTHRAIDMAPDPGFQAIDRFYAQLQRGLLARMLAQWRAAAAHFASARDAAQASRNDGALATALAQLGRAQLELGQVDEAGASAEAALSLARHCGARSAMTSAAGSLIVVHDALGRHAEALKLATESLEDPQRQAAGGLGRLSVMIALAHLRVGEIDRADAWLEGGSSVSAIDGDNAVFWAWVLVRSLLQRGESRYARDLAERTLLSRREKAPPFHLVELLHATADACAAIGREDVAQVHRDDARCLEETLGLRRRRELSPAAGYLPDGRHCVPAA
jgi:tetratricopeptide (TPR) repeat protein